MFTAILIIYQCIGGSVHCSISRFILGSQSSRHVKVSQFLRVTQHLFGFAPVLHISDWDEPVIYGHLVKKGYFISVVSLRGEPSWKKKKVVWSDEWIIWIWCCGKSRVAAGAEHGDSIEFPVHIYIAASSAGTRRIIMTYTHHITTFESQGHSSAQGKAESKYGKTFMSAQVKVIVWGDWPEIIRRSSEFLAAKITTE